MLAAYFAMARAAIEAHGGVVEKFIGDAVVGVFGVPAAHEDDPERAVRAGLRICEDAEELEAVGGGTAQAPRRDQHRGGPRAPRHRARLGRRVPSRRRDQHRLADPVGRPRDGRRRGPRHLRGHRSRSSTTRSSNPPRSRASPSRCGSSTRRSPGLASAPTSPAPTTPRSSVARSTSRCSRASSTRPCAADSPQLVTVVGEPGLGKSRIVAELGGYIDAKPDAHHLAPGTVPALRRGHHVLGARRDRQGARRDPGVRSTRRSRSPSSRPCSPKATSGPGSASASCRCSGSRPPPPPSARSCSPRGGGSSSTSPSSIPPCSCSRTCTGPTTRCSRSWNTSPTERKAVPLLVVGTARPELFERHPDYANGLRNATPINLAPLTEEETARLVSALLETDRDPRRAPAADPGSRRRQPPLRRGVRAPPEGQGPARSRRARAGSCEKVPRSRSPTRSRP